MSFLRDYLNFCKGNEASESYHLWSALVTLSSVVGRRVWIDNGHYVTYGNLYVVLVGPPGNRKTTAMSIAKKMMRQIGGIPFSAEAQSKEGLVKSMAENEVAFMLNGIPKTYCPLTVCITELKEFIATSNEKMINFLTTIYDQDFYDYKTRNKEDLNISNPYLTILACETPEWITLRLRDDVISGGFSRRTVFVFESGRRKRIAFPSINEDERKSWDDAIAHCQRIKDIAGEFKWTDESHDWYDNWYSNMVIPADNNLRGYYETKHVQMLKTAMLVAVSESSDLVLRTEYLKTALAFLDQNEINLPRVFEGMGRNELNMISTKIIDLLNAAAKPLTEKYLRAALWSTADEREFKQAVDHLILTEKVKCWGNRETHVKFLSTPEFVPPAVRLALERAAATKSDSSPPVGQPSAPSTTPDELTSRYLLNQQNAQAPSDAGANPPPTGGESAEKS